MLSSGARKSIKVREFERTKLCLGNDELRSFLEGLERLARRLGLKEGKVASVETKGDGHWLVAADFVGSAQVGPVNLIVQPKLSEANVLRLLLYAYEFPRFALDTLGSVDNWMEAIAFIFCGEVERLLKIGVHRNYQRFVAPLHTVRGKLRLLPTVRLQARGGTQIVCEYHLLTMDILENRILKAALDKVAQLGLRSSKRAFRLLTFLPEVSFEDLNAEDVDRVRYTRLNQHYRPALQLARLILDGISLSLPGEELKVRGFFVNMSEVFEKFTFRALREHLPRRWEVRYQYENFFSESPRLRIRPDFLIHTPDEVVVADAKYKIQQDPNDFYQISAYCHAFGARKCILIYASTGWGREMERLKAMGQPEIPAWILNVNLADDEISDVGAVAARLAREVERIVESERA